MITATTNAAEVQKTFRQYAALNKRSVSELLNNKLRDILIKAINLTKRVLPDQISQELGFKITTNVVTKRGKNRKVTSYSLRKLNNNSGVARVHAIINARRGKQGLDGLQGKEMDKASSKLIRARKFATGFAVVGWFNALKGLKGIAKGGSEKPLKVNLVGKAKGSVTPAKQNQLRTFAVAENKVRIKSDVISDGLAKAIQFVTKDMEQYIEKKLTENAIKAGFRKG